MANQEQFLKQTKVRQDVTSKPMPSLEHSTDTDKIYDEQVEKNILRRLLGHPLTEDLQGFTPDTRKILTNTEPILRQVKRNARGVIMSYEDAENYDLDILLTDVKYSFDNFTNAIDIDFKEIEELKPLTEDELADKKRILDLEKQLNQDQFVINRLQQQLNDTRNNLSSTKEVLNDLLGDSPKEFTPEELAEIEQIKKQLQTLDIIIATQGRSNPPPIPPIEGLPQPTILQDVQNLRDKLNKRLLELTSNRTSATSGRG